ncbi:hypothetical protein I1E95_14840 [Synechococcus sp. CBW1107]|uniref:hypothetical protein n=1 Tax=unclassified Synechococcus TaxID=2626047 RepID=UPI0018CF421C|nr:MULTISPECIES: hypothetical protein [unclassified Synechococcus]MCT0219642.1 hypothetical protein [Synechococcus sp. CS-1329]QPN56343.1 hypothetical protein I1E95_14840 [Synechococcus sp. CBW1107]
MFLDLALTAGVALLVSGDADLLAVKSALPSLLILSPLDFQSWLGTPSGGTGSDTG